MRGEHTGGGEQESAAQSPKAKAAGQPPPNLAPSPQIHISALQNRTGSASTGLPSSSSAIPPTCCSSTFVCSILLHVYGGILFLHFDRKKLKKEVVSVAMWDSKRASEMEYQK